MNIGIYKITNPKGKIYIGQSTNLSKRKDEYKKINSVKGQPKIFHSILKYGFENHTFEIIEECTLEQLNEREIYWGEYYKVLNKNGLNLRLGNGRGKVSDELKLQISKAHKGTKKPWAGKNLKLTDEHKKILIESRKNTSNPLFQYDLQGNFIKEWINPKQASRTLNIDKGCLYAVIDNPNKTSGGFIFTSIFRDDIQSTSKWKKHKKPVLQFDIQGNFIREWESAKDAALYNNAKVQNVTACCRKEKKTCNKFIFQYK